MPTTSDVNADLLPDWGIFRGDGKPHGNLANLPPAPPWRPFAVGQRPSKPVNLDDDKVWAPEPERALAFVVSPPMRHAVNAALYLRRPLLITGKPGTGKSSLIEAVAYELRMGKVLRWAITSRSTLKSGLYEYDALARLNDKDSAPIGEFVTLGPLGTALISQKWPRALLIDEIDKSDLDLPNDLLNIFERGEYWIPELVRHTQREAMVTVRASDGGTHTIENGMVQCGQFPFVILTSNGEREFPAPFLRRCIRLNIADPDDKQLSEIVFRHLARLRGTHKNEVEQIVREFYDRQKAGDLATDQLLNAIFLTLDLPHRPDLPKSITESERVWLNANLLSYLSGSSIPAVAAEAAEDKPKL
jgi:MoxR-like ATPase